MFKEWIFYLARAASALGNWMTFLAVALFISENFGADKVAYSFLIGSLPPLFLSNKASRAIPVHLQKKAYFLGLLIMSINVLLLIGATNLWHVYGYLLFASCVSAYLKPLLDSLVADSFDPSQLEKVLTRAGSLTTSILCIAPPLGAGLAVSLGYSMVFMVDAASFLVSGILLAFVFGPAKHVKEPLIEKVSLEEKQFSLLKEAEYPEQLRFSLYFWYLVLVLGALINAGEFGLFEHAAYTKLEIGYIVGAWGGGGLIAFLTSNFDSKKALNKLFVTYGLLLATFYLLPSFWLSCCVFVFSGLLAAKLGGMMRAMIQSQIPKDIRSLEVWGLVNSRLSLINMCIYGGVGFVIPYWGVTWISIPLILTVVLGIQISLKNRGSENTKIIKI